MFDLPPRPEYFSPEHETFRRSLRAFVEREIEPNVAAWDEAGGFPRELYRKAAAIGLIGMGYPEDLGGTPADLFFGVVSAEELARAGSGGLQASLGSHGIALPPVVAHGSQALKKRIVPPVLAGEKIAALAITEPGGGSDREVAAATRQQAERGAAQGDIAVAARKRVDGALANNTQGWQWAAGCAASAGKRRTGSRPAAGIGPRP